MKNLRKQDYILLAVVLLVPIIMIYGQDGLEGEITAWRDKVKPVVKAIIGLVSVGGGLIAYFKTNSDEGGSGKKAIGNFLLALIFGAALFTIIEFFT